MPYAHMCNFLDHMRVSCSFALFLLMIVTLQKIKDKIKPGDLSLLSWPPMAYRRPSSATMLCISRGVRIGASVDHFRDWRSKQKQLARALGASLCREGSLPPE